jgi:PAS domain-containing protein
VVLVFHDVSEKRRVQASMRESEARMQQALGVSRSFTFEWVPATDHVLRSDSCPTVLNLAGDEVRHDTGQRYFQRVHLDDRARFMRMLQALTPSADTYTTEYRVMRGDGGVVALEEVARPPSTPLASWNGSSASPPTSPRASWPRRRWKRPRPPLRKPTARKTTS